MKEPVTAFLRHVEVEKHAAPHTVRAYRADLQEFTRSVGVVRDATARDVRAWLALLHARGLDAVSVGRKLAAVRSFYRFLARRGVVRRNPAREVRAPRPARKLVTFLPAAEAAAVVDARGLAGAARDRDVAVLEMLYATGLRVSGLAGHRLDNLDHGAAHRPVHAPGGTKRHGAN